MKIYHLSIAMIYFNGEAECGLSRCENKWTVADLLYYFSYMLHNFSKLMNEMLYPIHLTLYRDVSTSLSGRI